MLINDSIFSMDEALTKLQNIRKTEREMDDASWNNQPPRQRQQRTQTHHQEEGHARYFMQFTNEARPLYLLPLSPIYVSTCINALSTRSYSTFRMLHHFSHHSIRLRRSSRHLNPHNDHHHWLKLHLEGDFFPHYVSHHSLLLHLTVDISTRITSLCSRSYSPSG